jgi:ABC-type glycerol-3-phosphate transport system substrate-binding protein
MPFRLTWCVALLAGLMLAGCSSPKPEAPTPSPSTPASSSSKALAESTVLFEATGTGTVYTIDTDPAQAERVENVTLPWQSTTTIGPDVQLLQVVVVGKSEGDAPGPGCRITLDGQVVAEEPVGGSAHCVYQIP